ncbi:hypothetical protein IWW36_002120 [Coemansia brasiliensis]|uniref:Uncharacterized protein n=1 Tax=Coemansia brasiliensis TaxID=2650707 RepID=A0A9W8I8J7_9FUNG|nr:hypothetical protein IWW36_002120 [Coemansia brasiliensis]
MFGLDLDQYINNGGFFIPANMSFNEAREFIKTLEEVDNTILDSYIAIKVYTGDGEVNIDDLKEENLHDVEMDSSLSEYEGKHLIAYTDAGEAKMFIIGGNIPYEVLKARL